VTVTLISAEEIGAIQKNVSTPFSTEESRTLTVEDLALDVPPEKVVILIPIVPLG